MSIVDVLGARARARARLALVLGLALAHHICALGWPRRQEMLAFGKHWTLDQT